MVTPLHRGGRVGDDGGEVVGEDCGDDDGPRWHFGATGSEGERAPLLLLLPWPPWHGRGESPSEIGSVSLSLSVSAFSDSTLSPFRIFPEIRNSGWDEILTRSLSGY